MFVTKTDLLAVSKDSAIQQIASGTYPTPQIVRAEAFALEEAKSYLNFKYDTNKVFGIAAFDYDATVSYTVGQVVLSPEGIAYNCVLDAPSGTLLTDTNYFVLGDLRNMLLVMILVDITLYHYYTRLPNNRITETRIVRYEQAIEKLKQIRKSQLNPELPLWDYDAEAHTTEQETHTIEIISQEKRNNHY